MEYPKLLINRKSVLVEYIFHFQCFMSFGNFVIILLINLKVDLKA